jgi:hypothetical protein
VLLVLAGARHAPARLRERVPARLRPLAPAVAAFVALGAALLVIAPVELVRAYKAIVLVGGLTASNPNFPLFQAEQDLGIVLGATSQFTVGDLATARLLPVLALLLAAVAMGAAALWTMARGERRATAALVAGVGGITLLTYLKYKFGDDYGYGAYKALISGGALLAGLLMLALASPSARWPAGRAAAAALCLAVWVPVSAEILQRQYDGQQGFRQSDNALIHELPKLPRDRVVLVEGAAENQFSFQLRMTTGYVAVAYDRDYDGLGSTFSYFTGGGSQPWRPQRPWDYVVTSDWPSAFTAHRPTVWERPPYRIQRAPAVDVTPYALSPDPPIGKGSPSARFWLAGLADGGKPADRIAGRVELIVSNRTGEPVRARLELGLRALPRGGAAVEIDSDAVGARRVPLPARGERTVTYRPFVPARGTTRVTLDPGPPRLDGAGNLVPLVAVTSVGIS